MPEFSQLESHDPVDPLSVPILSLRSNHFEILFKLS